MECHGDGDSYINAANETDYYTPKCVTVDNYMLITGGNIHCLSTGLGGKGLVAGNCLDIGSEEAEEGPFIRVETRVNASSTTKMKTCVLVAQRG